MAANYPSKQREYATRYMRLFRLRKGITKRPGVLGRPRGSKTRVTILGVKVHA
jgi:hypothetical protein